MGSAKLIIEPLHVIIVLIISGIHIMVTMISIRLDEYYLISDNSRIAFYILTFLLLALQIVFLFLKWIFISCVILFAYIPALILGKHESFKNDIDKALLIIAKFSWFFGTAFFAAAFAYMVAPFNIGGPVATYTVGFFVYLIIAFFSGAWIQRYIVDNDWLKRAGLYSLLAGLAILLPAAIVAFSPQLTNIFFFISPQPNNYLFYLISSLIFMGFSAIFVLRYLITSLDIKISFKH